MTQPEYVDLELRVPEDERRRVVHYHHGAIGLGKLIWRRGGWWLRLSRLFRWVGRG